MTNFLEERLKKNKINKFQNCLVNTFLSILKKDKYENVLEVGCGKGFFTFVAAKKGLINNSFCCDVFKDIQIEEIIPYVKNIDYTNINIKNNTFPYQDNKFDLVFSIDVIEHIEDDFKFVKENLRVCKSGGTIVIGTPNYFRITNIILKLFNRLKFPRKMGIDSYGDVIHLREYKKQDFEKIYTIFSNKILKTKPIPCWLGIFPFNLQIQKNPVFLSKFCQFWFFVITKK